TLFRSLGWALHQARPPERLGVGERVLAQARLEVGALQPVAAHRHLGAVADQLDAPARLRLGGAAREVAHGPDLPFEDRVGGGLAHDGLTGRTHQGLTPHRPSTGARGSAEYG